MRWRHPETAHSGMLAKLAACRRALDAGVRDIAIVAGRGVRSSRTPPALESKGTPDAEAPSGAGSWKLETR